MNLPQSTGVDVAKLASVFDETTNSYKFYWLLAILDELAETGNASMPLRGLSMRMLASVWYPLDYFKLSFGKQDGFRKAAAFISAQIVIDNRPAAPNLFKQLTKKLAEVDLKPLNRELDELLRWVPYRFIRPFFAAMLSGVPDWKANSRIAELAAIDSSVPYFFEKDPITQERKIILNENWIKYFQQHQIILRGFIFWNLLKFVQKNNPNVIGLSEKLEKPGERNFTIAKRFWKEFLDYSEGMTCIYSGQIVTSQNMSLDHFLPWSYVAHDQLWNIVPTPKAVNSAKSDWLPSLELYFERYAQLQYEAFQFHASKGNDKMLEDYSFLFAQKIESSTKQPFEWFRERLEMQCLPQFQTAQNLGFAYPFIFR